MKKITTLVFLIGGISLLFNIISCTKQSGDPINQIQFSEYYSEEELNIISPVLNLPGTPYTYPGLGSNFTSRAIGTLGRVLFYDKNFSADRSVSCASCHDQNFGFADTRAFSEGVNGNQTKRNSLSLGAFNSFREYYNTSFSSGNTSRFFWDERVGSLHEQMAQTIPNSDEMGMDLEELETRLKDLDYVQVLYEKAYQGQPIHMDNIFSALAAFVNSISANDSKFDDGFRFGSGNFENFTVQEIHGKDLFMDNCGSCHAFSLSSVLISQFPDFNSVACNGLEEEYSDLGQGALEGFEDKKGVFKVPGLKNIAITGPYMHDGRFETLGEVIDFYNTSIQPHTNLAEGLKDADGNPKQFNFTEEDKEALIAFFNTLTDETLRTEIKWSDPFK